MRVFGHPLHPMLVHFPIAFWSGATLCDVIAVLGLKLGWPVASGLIAAGLLTALPAMIAGMMDLAQLNERAVQDGNRHMMAMSAAWVLYLGAILTRLDGRVLIPDPQPISVALCVIGFALMALGGWYGGQLVYRHRAGIE